MSSGEWKSYSKLPAVRALQELVAPNHCVFCREELGPSQSRQRYVCKKPRCRQSYDTEYHAWIRGLRMKRGLTARGTEPAARSA